MDIVAALLLMIFLYVVIPVATCVIMIAILGGSERLLPGPMRRSITQRRHDR